MTRFRILNVFALAGDRLSGNPLCVFEEANGIDDAQMQALALQFNLSETTFILPSEKAQARVRIFTPTFEMPFAGHPTLGTAHVVRSLGQVGDTLALEMKAGIVPVTAHGDQWTLRAIRPPQTREPEASREALAAMLGLEPRAIDAPPLWVDTGAEQLVIPLATVADVRAAKPNPELLFRHGYSAKAGEGMAYVWARESDTQVVARFFFLSNGSLLEDPATGSACANLGGYLLATKRTLPLEWSVDQGEAVRRPSRLHLKIASDQSIWVSGLVIELGTGELSL